MSVKNREEISNASPVVVMVHYLDENLNNWPPQNSFPADLRHVDDTEQVKWLV